MRFVRSPQVALSGIALTALVLTACGKSDAPSVPSPPAASGVAPAPVAPPASGAASGVSQGQVPPPASPIASTDNDSPTPLASKQVSGVGLGQKVSYYYSLQGKAGTIALTATAKNRPSGATQALSFALYDTKASALCQESTGNTVTDKTLTLQCPIDKAQPLILRLDLSEETIDFTVALEGAFELSAPAASASATALAGPGSTDIDEPTRLKTNRIKGAGSQRQVAYYYAFNAGPGELTLTIDGKNVPAATTDALQVGLYSLRSEKLCEGNLGNTTLDKRAVVACHLDARQPVILRVDLSPESIDFRVRFDGPYDFDEFVAPKNVTIALDASVLFDTGAANLKAEARSTLDEAAARVNKFGNAPVTISGHTDSQGSDASNLTLSEKRANAVRDYFVAKAGVAPSRLTVKGFGKTQPVADNGTEAGRARNRRVEVLITPK